jgi:hypothetical protein
MRGVVRASINKEINSKEFVRRRWRSTKQNAQASGC